MSSSNSCTSKKKYKRRTKNKKTNDKSVANFQWNPPRYDPTNIHRYPYHQSFPMPIETTNKDLSITINKKYSFKLPWKDSYIVICLYNQCRKSKWSKWTGRRPFYSFNKYHHRKVHGHEPYHVQIVSRMTMSKYRYLKEYRLVDHTPKQSPYPHQQPTKYYLDNTQRSINLMHIIFNDFLAMPLCKQPLNAYLIRELIFWASQQPHFKIKHHYLFKPPPKTFQISYNVNLVYSQMIRNHKSQIQQELQRTKQLHSNSMQSAPMTQIVSDEDDDIMMNELKMQSVSSSPSYEISFFL